MIFPLYSFKLKSQFIDEVMETMRSTPHQLDKLETEDCLSLHSSALQQTIAVAYSIS